MTPTKEVRLCSLVQCLLDNDPNDDAADGVTVLEVWRKEAEQVLALPRRTTTDGAVEVVEGYRNAFRVGDPRVHDVLCGLLLELKALPQPVVSFDATPAQAEAMAHAICQLLDDMEFKDIGGCVSGYAIQQAKEAIEPFAEFLELEPHERAKPNGGFAAGVAACSEAVGNALAYWNGPGNKEEHLGEDAICEVLEGVLKKLRQLSPTAHDKLVEALRDAALNARLPEHFHWGEDAMEQFDFGKERAAKAVVKALTYHREKGQ